MAKEVAPLRPTAKIAQDLIRKLSADSSNVIIGYHAQERMEERDISSDDVYEILSNGLVLEEPQPARPGEWKVKVTMRLRGARDASAITIILEKQQLFVMTVQWDDV